MDVGWDCKCKSPKDWVNDAAAAAAVVDEVCCMTVANNDARLGSAAVVVEEATLAPRPPPFVACEGCVKAYTSDCKANDGFATAFIKKFAGRKSRWTNPRACI